MVRSCRLASLFTRPFVVSWLSPSHFNLNANFINLPLKRQILVSKPKRYSCFVWTRPVCGHVLWMACPVWKPAKLLRQAGIFAVFNSTLPHLASSNPFLRITPNRTSLLPHMLSLALPGPPCPCSVLSCSLRYMLMDTRGKTLTYSRHPPFSCPLLALRWK